MRIQIALERLEPLIAAGDLSREQAVAAVEGMERDRAYRDQQHATAAALALAARLAEAVRAGGVVDKAPAAPTLPPEASQPWPELTDRFFADRPSVGASAKVSYQQAFREFEALIGHKALGDVTKADVKAFTDHLRDRPINRTGRQTMSRASIVKMLSHLKAFFGWAVASGFITASPADGVQPRTETREE